MRVNCKRCTGRSRRVGCRAASAVLVVGLAFLGACGGGGSAPAGTPAPSAVLSGVVAAPAGTAADGDVNDPNVSLRPNNDAAMAQEIPNPVILGGFVTATATGVSGDRFATSGDPVDRYRVALADGQTLTLFISDWVSGGGPNLDLFLFAAGGTVALDRSETTAASESITVSGSASYDIEVRALSGRSNYVLVVGQSAQGTGGTGVLSADLPFVPGEALVRFRAAAPGGGGTARVASATGSAAGNRSRLYRFDVLHDEGIARAARRMPVAAGAGDRDAKKKTIDLIRALRRRGDVLSADPNYMRYPMRAPDDTHYDLQWHYPLINLPQAWEVSAGSSSVVVAVIDTGVMMTHPDLSSKLTATGYDFVSDSTRSNDGDEIDPDPDDPGDNATPGSSSFHGTHVAGTVAAATNNASGVAGAGWDIQVMPVRALAQGGGTSNDLIQSVRYAAGLPNDSGVTLSVTDVADVINMSLGGPGFSTAEQAEFTAARNQGVLLIAAAGNEGSRQANYPAAYDGVISVSAVGPTKVPTGYSNFGTAVDLAAPGGDMTLDQNQDGYPDGVLSTFVDDSSGTRQPVFAFAQGTSMATPHVAGVAGLMKSVYGGLTPQLFSSWLVAGDLTSAFSGTEDYVALGYGAGVLDAFKSVKKANSENASPTPLPPIPSVHPSAISFGRVLETASIELGNLGDQSFDITSATDDAAWMTVTQTSADVVGQSWTYTVDVNRASLAEGIYAGSITFTTDTAGNVTVPVTMQVALSAAGTGDAGLHYVQLINARFGLPVKQAVVTGSAGQYVFSFSNVFPGQYYLIAGTDMDNDGRICDAGEACAGYPIANELAVIEIAGAGRTDLTFVTGFGVGLGTNISSKSLSLSNLMEERSSSRVIYGNGIASGSPEKAVALRPGKAGIPRRVP